MAQNQGNRDQVLPGRLFDQWTSSLPPNLSDVWLIVNCSKRDVKMGREFLLDEKNSDHIIVITDIGGKGGLMVKEKVIIYGKTG